MYKDCKSRLLISNVNILLMVAYPAYRALESISTLSSGYTNEI